MTKADLLPQILLLAPEDRWSLIDDIRESLTGDEQLSPEQLAELDRRLQAVEGEPVTGDSWDVVLARLRARP